MIIKAKKINGEVVFAQQEKQEKGTVYKCIQCGCSLCIKKKKNSEEKYFAKWPKAKGHTSVCRFFEDESTMAPIITGETPEQLISRICTPTKKRDKSKETETKPKEKNNTNSANTNGEKIIPVRKLKSVKDFINSGAYYEDPYSPTYFDWNKLYIDYIIFDKSARDTFGNGLIPLGWRIIDCRWLGDINFGEKFYQDIEDDMNKTKNIWFEVFWPKYPGSDEYEQIMICFKCSEVYSAMVKKMFTDGAGPNGKYRKFIGKKGKHADFLLAADFSIMSREDCEKICPMKHCIKSCNGALWCKGTTTKQIESFPTDEITKNKEAMKNAKKTRKDN